MRGLAKPLEVVLQLDEPSLEPPALPQNGASPPTPGGLGH